uniref:Uncharacterized protein n=1 Tax=Cajanus cajan TaxID=3821 RepID=A0A151TKS0_CAJCA|nr:hypothetical protein KK1_023996 [Cajanus cajan]
MSLYMLFRVREVEIKPTCMTLQLVDRSIKIKNMLVKVDKIIFSSNFIIIDIKDDLQVPIILGRPFMMTTKALINVANGKFKLRMQDEVVAFYVFERKSQLLEQRVCLMIK